MAEFTDISGVFANSAEMISECKGTVYGYLRVSTAAQKHGRQMDAMKELGVEEGNMFFDKQSGKDFNRPGYQGLLAKLKEGDLVVIKNIDRLGRNTKEVKEQWRILTQEKHVSIVVVDTPVLNAGKELGTLGQALSDIIFAIFSMVADFDRQSIYQRLQEGLRVAMRERGVRPGRKAKTVPEEFDEIKEAYEKGKVSQRVAASQLGVDRKTFRKWLNKAEIMRKKAHGQEQKPDGLQRNGFYNEDTFNEDAFSEDTFNEDTFNEDTLSGDTFNEDVAVEDVLKEGIPKQAGSKKEIKEENFRTKEAKESVTVTEESIYAGDTQKEDYGREKAAEKDIFKGNNCKEKNCKEKNPKETEKERGGEGSDIKETGERRDTFAQPHHGYKRQEYRKTKKMPQDGSVWMEN